MSGLSSIWLMIGLIQWSNKLSSCDSTVGLHVLRWKWTTGHISLCTYITTPVTGTCPFACMDKNAMQKSKWELMGYASVLTNTSWDYFLIMDYGSYQPYGQPICKMPSYRENLWGYTFTIIRKTAKSSHLYFLNEAGTATTESRVTGTYC